MEFYVQTFGDLVTFNPHIHALVADGVFMPALKWLRLLLNHVPDIA